MPIEIRAIKKATKPEVKPSKSPPVAQKKQNKVGSKKSPATPWFIEVPEDYQPPSPPPELKPSKPLAIDETALFYQAIAQLTGVVVAIDGFVYLQLAHATVKLMADKKYGKRKLLKQLGQTIGVKGWLSRNGTQLVVLSVTQPHEKDIIALAGIPKNSDNPGTINLLVPRNAPVKTENFLTFTLSMAEPPPARAKFIRCFATFFKGGLQVETITASAPFPPKYKKDKK